MLDLHAPLKDALPQGGGGDVTLVVVRRVLKADGWRIAQADDFLLSSSSDDDDEDEDDRQGRLV